MIEVREVLRGWLDGGGLRTVAERAGVDRKTARRYVEAAQAAGLVRGAPLVAVTDGLIGAVVEQVRPVRPDGHGPAWAALAGRREEITGWVGEGLSLVKVHELLARSGTSVPYRTVHRFASAECGFTGRRRATTVRVVDGDPGVECQIDFAQMGLLLDPETGRRRKVHALIVTAVVSRHMYVHLSFGQRLEDVIAGCEAAWVFFGGVFKVIVPDNLKPVVTQAESRTGSGTSTGVRLSLGWLDYSQHAGFVTDPARVRSPQDKPRVERAVQYVRGNFWAGETFTDLPAAQAAATSWCAGVAGMRMHGTLAARPLEVFTALEAPVLLPVPAAYDVPVLRSVKVHRDHHVEVAKALYSVPTGWIGSQLDARADTRLVKLFHRGRLIKTHPRMPPGGRSTDPSDLPAERTGYAMRDLDRLRATADDHGTNIGIYVHRLLDDPLPWTRMRAVYRLLGLVRRYGPDPVDAACGTALDLDVISVTKIARMLERALEPNPTGTTGPTGATGPVAGQPVPQNPRIPIPPTTGRFARRPEEFTRPTQPAQPTAAPSQHRQLTLVPDPAPETDPVLETDTENH